MGNLFWLVKKYFGKNKCTFAGKISFDLDIYSLDGYLHKKKYFYSFMQSRLFIDISNHVGARHCRNPLGRR